MIDDIALNKSAIIRRCLGDFETFISELIRS